MKRRIVSLLLLLAILASYLPINVFASNEEENSSNDIAAIIYVESTYCVSGSTVDVNINILNNPGIAGAKITITYDSKLSLIGAESGIAFSELDYTEPASFDSPCPFNWDSLDAESITDGTILKLSFAVSAEAVANEQLNIEVSYNYGDIYDADLDSVVVGVIDGSLRVIDFTPGDVNEDGVVNGKDVTLIRRLNANYDVEIRTEAADVNDDGVINGKDVTLIRRYNAGYDVTLLPPTPRCKHTTMTAFEAKDNTCTEAGNCAYWHCADCGKYFSDEDGNTEIELADTVISAAHKLTYVAACPATTETAGNIEHWFCGECNKYFANSNGTVEIKENNVIIPKLERGESSVIYNVFGGDTYLESLGIENSNPSTFYAEDGLVLNDLIAPDGYTFNGWTTASGTPITEIEPGSVRQITVNATWSKTTYWVNFNSPLVPLEPIARTIDQTTTFEKQKLDGYTFMGWSDDSGNIISDYMIKPGTKDITLHANWTSNRNLTRPSDIGTPIIHFDEGNNQILFAYEIGKIENIPLYDLGWYEYIMAPTDISSTVTKSITIDEAAAQAISQAISNATTNTSAWTLSNEWTNSSSISEEHLDEIDSSVSSNWSSAYSESGTYNISTSNGGSTTTVVEAGVSAKVGVKTSHEASVGFPIDVIDVGAKVKNEISAEVGTELSTSQSDIKTWNTNQGYSSSQEASQSQSLSSTLAQKISNAVSYNVSKSATESTSNSYSTATTSTDSREYASTFTYTTVQFEEETYTKTLNNAPAGHYRLVAAGTAHVFAVVTYDIATNAYGVYTYSIMEDEVTPFLDYSKETRSFNDNENGVLNFEVPYYINEYVDSIIGASDGLVVNTRTGIIEEYNGTDDIVVIPQYMPVDNGDETVTVVKITGFADNAFSGQNIKAVQLNTFINEIPAGAFNGCEELVIVYAPAVTKIGDRAFEGCVALKNFTVSEQVTALGNQAFVGVQNVMINASNTDVATASITCGAKCLTLNMAPCGNTLSNARLEVSSITEYFGFMGGTKTYEGVTISSDAKTTVINGANFINNDEITLEFASENVTLNRVNVETSGWSMVLKAENTNLNLQGEVNLNSSGTNSILSRNVTISKANASVASSLNVEGNMWVCGDIQGASYLTVNGTLAESISPEFYDQLLLSSLEWVLATDDVPEGAQIISEKWKYDLTTNITSDQEYVDGYTLYDTTYGEWSEWSTTEITESDSRNVETNLVVDKDGYYEYCYSRYVNRYAVAGNNAWSMFHYCQTCATNYYGTSSDCWAEDWTSWSTTRRNTIGTWSCSCGKTGTKYDGYWYKEHSRYIEPETHIEYRYRDIKYYHTKTEAMESETEITASDSISNVQKWVQYIVM